MLAGAFVLSLAGGLTAMPGAVPIIWCDMRGMPNNDQRGLVQPFIAIMQMLAWRSRRCSGARACLRGS